MPETMPTSNMASKINQALLLSNISFGNTGVGNYSLRLGKNLSTPGSIDGWAEADFDGYAAIQTAVGWVNGNDPVLGHPTMMLSPPAGGFRWVAGPNLSGPQTIKSIRIDNLVGNYPMGVGNIIPPITVGAVGDQVNIGPVYLTILIHQ